jgi:hypothetical protein
MDEDPFGASNAELGGPSTDFGLAPDPAPAYAAPAPAPLATPASFSFADEDPFGSSGAELGGTSDAAPAPMPAAPGMDEFGPSFGGAVPHEQAAPAAPAPAFAPPGPMDFGMLGDDQMPPEEGASADPGGMADPFAAPQPAGGMADPFAAPQPAGGMADPFAAADATASMADPFAAPQPAGGIPDPFANAEPAFSPTATGRQRIGPSEGFLTQTDTSHRVISPTDTGRHMLDLPPHEGAEPAAGEEPAAPASRELIDLPAQPPESSAPRPVPTLAAPSIAKPAGRPADMGLPERRKPTTAQAVTSQVAYLTIAAGLLLAITAVGGVYVKKGRVDSSALSPTSLATLLTPSQFVAQDVTNGLYDTRGGAPVFYVRGMVENRTAKPARVKVSAGLYDGGQRVKSQEGLAGMVPGPEDLHAVTSADALEQLRSKLDAGATVIPPGGRAPFILVFQEYPQELSAFRLRVTAEAAPEEGSKP